MIEHYLEQGMSGHKSLFNSPFWDIASQYVPRDIKTAFRWAEYLYSSNPTYSSAIKRIARYLITDLDLSGQHNSIILRYQLLFDKLKIRRVLATFGITSLVYGNAFLSVSLPFDRILKCPTCGTERVARATDYEFQDWEYNLHCPCGYYGAHKRIDKFSDDVSRTKVLLWDPKLIEINKSITGECEYYMHVPPLLKYKIETKNKFILDTTPWEFIESVKKNGLFKFSPGSLLHIATETLPGFNMEWGLPPSVALFKLHYQSAILRKVNEAVALDYILPFRVMFPQAGSAGSDPVQAMGLSKWVSKIEEMIKKHRADPTFIQIAPVPVGYESIGGEGKALNTSPEQKAINEELLNGAGFPADLFYGTLHVQALPSALRLFENSWDHLFYGYNEALQFIANKVGKYFSWESIIAKLQRITLADDIEKRQILMQVAASGIGSQASFFKAYGMDWNKETEKAMREQIEMGEIQKKVMEDYKLQQQTEEGAAPTPQDRTFQAQQLATQVVSDPMNSRQLLHQLAQTDEQLYALVKMYVERIRTQMASQQGREALQQGLMAAGAGGVTGAGTIPIPPPPM